MPRSAASRSRRARRRRALLLAAVVAGLAASAVHRSGPSQRTDLPVYRAAADELAEGRDPLLARSSRGWPYIYPATLAVLVMPLRALPLRAAALLWFAVGAGAFVAGAAACRAARGRRGRWGRPESIAVLGVSLPLCSALLRGQVGPLLLGAAGGGLYFLARGRDAAAGALFALAAAIKIVPGLVLLGLLAVRRGRACAAFALALVFWVVLLPAPFLGLRGSFDAAAHCVRVMAVRPLDRPGEVGAGAAAVPVTSPTNQSLTALVARRTRGRTAMLFGAVAGVVLCAVALRARSLFAVCSSLLAVPLVVAPVAWHHHHVVLSPVLLELAERRRFGPLGIHGAGLFLHFLVLPARPLALLGWGTLAVAVSVRDGDAPMG